MDYRSVDSSRCMLGGEGEDYVSDDPGGNEEEEEEAQSEQKLEDEDEEDQQNSCQPRSLHMKNSDPPSTIKPAEQGRNSRDDWSDLATQALLHVWGATYSQLGRKILKLEDWSHVAHQVALHSHAPKTDVQCRNRIHTLKKKYKREKQKLVAFGHSEWLHFAHMDSLLNSVPQQPVAIPCSVDAGKIATFNTQGPMDNKQEKHFADSSPVGTDLDSSENSLRTFEDSDTDTRRTSRKRKLRAPFHDLAKALKKFAKVYEKIETTKQQQLLDLEKSRMQLTKDFELKKMQLFMQTQVELAKLKQGINIPDSSVRNGFNEGFH